MLFKNFSSSASASYGPVDGRKIIRRRRTGNCEASYVSRKRNKGEKFATGFERKKQ